MQCRSVLSAGVTMCWHVCQQKVSSSTAKVVLNMVKRFSAACARPSGPLGRLARRMLGVYQSVLAHPAVNLPLGATIAGIACAAVGPVRSLLVDELAALHWLWLSLVWVGAAAAPLATMQIGEYSHVLAGCVQCCSCFGGSRNACE